MLLKIKTYIESLSIDSIEKERKKVLDEIVNFIQRKRKLNEVVNLVFICTHNSRRSQFSEIWASVISDYFGVSLNTFSGGIEVTEFNKRAINSLKRLGFIITSEMNNQPIYNIAWSENNTEKLMFSKLYDAKINPNASFAAIMTCSDADENCPFIPGAEERIPLRYEDPKKYDNSPSEKEAYDSKSREIATEMKYIFSKIK